MSVKKYKTPEENFIDNRKKKFDQNTIFMITYVDSPGATSTNQWGKTQLDGFYIVWNPADKQRAFVQKWMLTSNVEKVAGDTLKWDDFKTGKVHDYKPIYLEWKDPTPDKEGRMFDNEKFYEEHITKVSSAPADEFYKNYTEKELRFILKENGFEEDSVDADIEFIMEENKQLDIRTALYLLCKRLNVKQKSTVATKESLESSDILAVLEGMFSEIKNYMKHMEEFHIPRIMKILDSLTSGGNIALKDLLTKSKLGLIMKEEKPEESHNEED